MPVKPKNKGGRTRRATVSVEATLHAANGAPLRLDNYPNGSPEQAAVIRDNGVIKAIWGIDRLPKID